MTQVRDTTKNVITIQQEKTVYDAVQILRKKISFLSILKNGKPSGIISERDIVRKTAAEDTISSLLALEKIMLKKFQIGRTRNIN